MAGSALSKGAGPIGDPELEEGRLLDDVHGALRIRTPASSTTIRSSPTFWTTGSCTPNSSTRFRQHGEGQVDVARDVTGHPVRLVEFEPEVHPALQVEPELQRNVRLHRVPHGAVRPTGADAHFPRKEAVDGQRHEGADDQEAVSD